MHKKISIILILICLVNISNAQLNIDSTGTSLEKLAQKIKQDTDVIERYIADSTLTKELIQTLKNQYSFNYFFDSLKSIQKITAPDNAFKIFSWQLDLGNGKYRQRAAIQMNTDNGSLKLLPFFDHSDEMYVPEKEFCTRKNWLGAIYYDIIVNEFNGNKYYTLLGFDEYNLTTSRKIIEVIHFENGEPILGGDFFSYPADETFPIAPIQRFVLYYKKGSNAYIKYDKAFQTLTISELSSLSKDLMMRNSLVPTGNELFFEWKNGKWVMPELKE